jgi:hypothetical protein
MLIPFAASELKTSVVLIFERRASPFEDASKILNYIFFNDAFQLHRIIDNIIWNTVV